ncbi:uncharacterized protein PSFLO_03858 [Pseudozyma flocculosa]|nr:uncharacterized protein PSFLO_03858 [Pseudozyma flocculosa]
MAAVAGVTVVFLATSGPQPAAAAPTWPLMDELGAALGRFRPGTPQVDRDTASNLAHPPPPAAQQLQQQHAPSDPYSFALDSPQQPRGSDPWYHSIGFSAGAHPGPRDETVPLDHLDAYAELGSHPWLVPHVSAGAASPRYYSPDAWHTTPPSSPHHNSEAHRDAAVQHPEAVDWSRDLPSSPFQWPGTTQVEMQQAMHADMDAPLHSQHSPQWAHADVAGSAPPEHGPARPVEASRAAQASLDAEQDRLQEQGVYLLEHGVSRTSKRYRTGMAGLELQHWLEQVYSVRNRLAASPRWKGYDVKVVADSRSPGNLLRDTSVSAKLRGQGSPSPGAFADVLDPLNDFQIGQHQIVVIGHTWKPAGADLAKVRYSVMAIPRASWEGSIALGKLVLTKTAA